MLWLIAVFCFLTFSVFAEEEPQEELILSTPEQLAVLKSEPDYLIGGLVSPMSGQLALRQTDLVVRGAQNVYLERVYIPPYMPCFFSHSKQTKNKAEYDQKYLTQYLSKNYRGWEFFPHVRLQLNPMMMQVRLSEPNGATFDFQISGTETTLVSLPYAISNVAGEEPNGKYDPRNTRISYEDNGNKIVVYASDGTIRFYDKKDTHWSNAYLFLLQKEIFPNGKVLRYRYQEGSQPYCVESLDSQEMNVYASLNVASNPSADGWHFTSSSGITADYKYTRKFQWIKIKEKNKKEDTKHRNSLF